MIELFDRLEMGWDGMGVGREREKDDYGEFLYQ